jgi:hypothetical protein
MPPTTHAKLSPSGTKRWLNCPGSVALSEGIPDGSSFYAAEGSAAHELLEKALHNEGPVWEPEIGEPWEHDGFTGEVTQEMVDAVQVAVDYVRKQVAEAEDIGFGVEPEVRLERRVNFDRLNPPEGLDGGTCDVTIWSGPEMRNLHVIDYKHGQGVFVEVEGNEQLLSYALGAIATDGRRPDRIKTTIIQPRHHAGDPVRSAEYTWAEIVEFKRDLFAAAEDTAKPGAPLVVGDWCRFCPALPQCPAQADHATQLAQAEFDELDADTAPTLLADPKLMTPDQLGAVLDGAKFVEDWIKAVRAHVSSLIDRGEEVPGWKLVEGRANRRWSDEERAERYMARKGLGVDERFTRKLVSPAQAEKALKAAGHKPSYIQRFIEQPKGSPKLAPASAAALALPSSAESDFAHLMEDPE